MAMSKASTITTTSSSSSKRLCAEKESVQRTTRRSQSSDGGLPVEEQQLLEEADAVDPTEDEGEKERVHALKKKKEESPVAAAAVVPPRGRGRPRKVRPAAEVVIVAQETGEKEKVQQLSEKDEAQQQQQLSERKATQQQESDKEVAQPHLNDKQMMPQETDKEVAGSAPGNEDTSADVRVNTDFAKTSEPQEKDDGGSGGAAAVELEDNDDDDGGFDIKEGDEITVLDKASGGVVELRIGDAITEQGPDALRKEDGDEQLQPPRDQENQDPTQVESSVSANAKRKSTRMSSIASDNGSTASTSTQTKPGNSSKRKLEDQSEPELQRQREQNNPANTKNKKKQKTKAKISPASSRNLFQFTCKLLESQRLEYEVRAREFEEKNAVLAAKRAKWEKKIRSVKRQLRGYGHPVDGVYDESNSGAPNGRNLNVSSSIPGPDSSFHANPNWDMATSTALTTTSGGATGMNSSSSGSNTSLITMRDAFSSRTSFPSGFGGVDSLLPASIQSVEAQIRDTLGARAKLVNDLMKDLQGVRGLNDKITRLR